MNRRTIILSLISLIFLGIIAILGFENVLLSIGLIWGTILSLGILILAGIYDLMRRTKVAMLPAGIFMSFSVVLLSQFTIRDYLNDKKKSKAEKLIEVIEEYKINHGMYPDRSAIEEQIDDDLFYNRDNRGNDYTISFLIDGWHTRTYLSNEKKWSEID